MSMKLILKIEIAPSDVSNNKRFWYKEEGITTHSPNKTGSFYINDKPTEYMKIISWFNDYNEKSDFVIDVQATKNYIDDTKNYIFSNLKNFQFSDKEKFITLEEYTKEELKFLKLKTEKQRLKINPMISSGKDKNILSLGKSQRYLKFDNNCENSKYFCNLLFNKTEINISLDVKSDKRFFVIYPRLLANFRRGTKA